MQLGRSMVASGKPTLGWGPLPPSRFNYDPIQVRQEVYDFKAWAAIIINPNATSMLYSAVQNGNTSYDPLGAIQLVYQDARDDTIWYDFMLPLVSEFMTEAQSMVGSEWTRMVLQNATTDRTLLTNIARVPQALSPAIGYSQYNLRPFYPYQTIPAVTVGLIYLIIISFFSFAFYLPVWMQYLKPEGHPPLKFWQLVTIRWLGTVAAYFFLSLAYSLISLAFQINFSGGNPVSSETQPTLIEYGNPDSNGKRTFMIYWVSDFPALACFPLNFADLDQMLNFVGMNALGLACENVAMFVGQPWTGLWLIFWVITNVSTSFYDITIEPHFYYWGYAWPLHSGKYHANVTTIEERTLMSVQWWKAAGICCLVFTHAWGSTLESSLPGLLSTARYSHLHAGGSSTRTATTSTNTGRKQYAAVIENAGHRQDVRLF